MSVETFIDEKGEYGPKGKEYVFEPGTGPNLDDREEPSIEEEMQELVEDDSEAKVEMGQADFDIEREGEADLEEASEVQEQADDNSNDKDLLFADGEVVS